MMNEHDETISRMAARVLARMPVEVERIRREKHSAKELVGKLLELPPALRWKKIQRSYFRLRTRAVVEALLEHSRRAASAGELEEAGHLGELAWYAQSFLPEGFAAGGGLGGMNDLRAMIRGQQGQIARRRCSWEAAKDFFREAWCFLEGGLGDVECRGRLCYLNGLLFRDRGALEKALDLLDEAASSFRQLGLDTPRGKVYIAAALVLWQRGDAREALDLHLKALNLLDEEVEPKTAAAAHCNAALLYNSLGRHEEAASMLRIADSAFKRCPQSSWVHLKRIWVEGMVAQALHDSGRSESSYLAVREAFRLRDDPQNEALVSLDLATLYAEQDRFDDLAAIAEETYEALRSQELEPEAEKALKLFVDAARRREAAIEIIRTAAQWLRTHPGICAKCP